jgi:hypothetical protein
MGIPGGGLVRADDATGNIARVDERGDERRVYAGVLRECSCVMSFGDGSCFKAKMIAQSRIAAWVSIL